MISFRCLFLCGFLVFWGYLCKSLCLCPLFASSKIIYLNSIFPQSSVVMVPSRNIKVPVWDFLFFPTQTVPELIRYLGTYFLQTFRIIVPSFLSEFWLWIQPITISTKKLVCSLSWSQTHAAWKYSVEFISMFYNPEVPFFVQTEIWS